MSKKNKTEHKGLQLPSAYVDALKRLETSVEKERSELEKSWSESRDNPMRKKCPVCGRAYAPKRLCVPRNVTTRLGKVTYIRHQYYCEKCKRSWFPRDSEIGLEKEDGEYTEDVVQLTLDFAINDTFEKSSERLEMHHNIKIGHTGIRNLFERATAKLSEEGKRPSASALPLTSVNSHQPVVVMNDGSQIRRTDGWHEVKLMSVRVNGDVSGVYFAEALDAAMFEEQMRNAPGYRKLRNRTVVWLADGAAYNWNLQERLCPHAKPLLDFMHLKEHLYACANELLGEGDALVETFVKSAIGRILKDRADEVIKELKECYIEIDRRTKGGKSKRDALSSLWNYLEKNRRRLNYRGFLENGWPIATGEIESAHKHVIQTRMKRAGMMWSPKNAQRMSCARAIYQSTSPSTFYSALKNAA